MTNPSTQDNLAVGISPKISEQIKNSSVGVSENSVREFLKNNPDFFLKHSDLLENLDVTHPSKGTVSLVETRNDQLKKRIQQLSKQLNQLISVAKQNEEIYRVYVALNLQLMSCKSIEEVQRTIEHVMLQELDLASAHVIPFKGPNALPELQQRLITEKRFRCGGYFFGRLSQNEKQLLFGDDTAESVALVLVGDNTPIAILAVGSQDPGHFAPSMDTLMLKQLQQMLYILLSDFLDN